MQYAQEKLLNNFQAQIVPAMKEWNNIHTCIREFNFWCQKLGFPQSFFLQVASKYV